MKKVTIKNLSGIQTHGVELEDPTAWIAECVAANAWGFPERLEIGEDGQPTGEILPADYTIEIQDISEEYALNQIIASRRAEYPTAEEFLNAFFDGGQSALDDLQALRVAVKAKYPKP